MWTQPDTVHEDLNLRTIGRLMDDVLRDEGRLAVRADKCYRVPHR